MQYCTEAIYRQIYVTSLLAAFNHVYPLHDCPHFIVICMIVSWPGIFIIYRLVLHIYTHPYTRVSNIYLHSVRHWRRRQDSNLIFQLHNFPAFEFFQIFVKLLFLGFTCAITYKNTQNLDEIFVLKYPHFREINLCICVVDWKFLKSAIKGFLQEVIIRSNIRGTDSRM